jgi:hypothetical protein
MGILLLLHHLPTEGEIKIAGTLTPNRRNAKCDFLTIRCCLGTLLLSGGTFTARGVVAGTAVCDTGQDKEGLVAR